MRNLLVFLISCLSFSLYSQSFTGGFFGGLSASQVDGDLFSGYNKVGLTAGAFTIYNINRNLKWKTEIRYIQKGAYKRNTEMDPTLFKTSLHYAEIPFLIHYIYNKKVFLEAGPVPEILLASKEENEDGEIPESQILPFHRFTLEGTAGLGYFISDNLAAGFRYTYSLLTARDHASGQTYMLNRGQYNNVLSFTVYYQFR